MRYANEWARERDRRSRLVEQQIRRFREAREFIEFARSEAGLAWLRADSGETRVRRGLLGLVVAGILALALGGALLAVAARLSGAVDPNDVTSRASSAWWGTVSACLGAGSLLSVAVLARLGRQWGLLPPG